MCSRLSKVRSFSVCDSLNHLCTNSSILNVKHRYNKELQRQVFKNDCYSLDVCVCAVH